MVIIDRDGDCRKLRGNCHGCCAGGKGHREKVERFWSGTAIDVARSLEMNERSAPLSIKASAGVEKGPRVTETRIFDDEVEVDMAMEVEVEVEVKAKVKVDVGHTGGSKRRRT